ncbi:MAG: hypothetical protein WBM98_01640 [Maribacter sp.]|uniref:hypothetical protein n=1 Tax=Maribacter sp. TaxID=1897614 RepID=UPI003C74AD8B
MHSADEAGIPIDNHIKAFCFAKDNDIKCAANAAEAKGPESAWETIENIYPLRIGHGVRSAEDVELLIFLKENKIHLKVCPTSNIQVNVFDEIEDNCVDNIFNFGISRSINSDTRTISNVTLEKEYQLLTKIYNWEKDHFKKCDLEAIEHSFATEEVK